MPSYGQLVRARDRLRDTRRAELRVWTSPTERYWRLVNATLRLDERIKEHLRRAQVD